MKTYQKKKRLIVIILLIQIYAVFFCINKNVTYAWFTTEVSGEGVIVNATTADFLEVYTEVTSYAANCQVTGNVTVKNISSYTIPIRIGDEKNNLKSNEAFTVPFSEKVSCQEKAFSMQLYGFQGFINEEITILLDSKQLELSQKNEKEEKKY